MQALALSLREGEGKKFFRWMFFCKNHLAGMRPGLYPLPLLRTLRGCYLLDAHEDGGFNGATISETKSAVLRN